MEDRWHGPEDPTNQDPETTRKKRRGTDFLSQYLLRRKEQYEGHIEDTDEEEVEEKPKKFRRFFRSLFKSVVESPVDKEARTSKRFGLESLFIGSQTGPEVVPLASGTELHDQVADSVAQQIEVALPESSQESQLFSTEHLPVEITDPASSEVRAADMDQITSLESKQGSPDQSSIETPLSERAVPLDRTIFERAQTQAAEKEVIIERGTGIALPVALVGAEYLARKKADRKLDAKYEEKVTDLKIENKQKSIATEQLSSLVTQNREQLEALKRDRGIVSSPEKPRITESVAPHIEQQPTLRQTPEQTPENLLEKPETYKIMEQVAEAAEHNAPVERVFERSHEVKDDHTIPVVGAASIGSIMADKAVGQRAGTQNTIKLSQTAGGLPVVSDHVQTAAYKQAMRNGFWTAIIIIIIGTLAYLLK